MSLFKQKQLDAKKLFSCYVKKYDSNHPKCPILTEKTVVYQVGDKYYDMRRIMWASELKEEPTGDFVLFYEEYKRTYPPYYCGKQCEMLAGSLRPYYKDGRLHFTIKELLKDMVADPEIYTDSLGFTTWFYERIDKNKK